MNFKKTLNQKTLLVTAIISFILICAIIIYSSTNYLFKLYLFAIFCFILTNIIIWIFFGIDYRPEDVDYFNTSEPDYPEETDPIVTSYFVEGGFPNTTWFSTAIIYFVWKKIYRITKNNNDYILERNKTANFKQLPFFAKEVDDYLYSKYKNNSFSIKEFKKLFVTANGESEKYHALEQNLINHYDDLFYRKEKYFSTTGITLFYVSFIGLFFMLIFFSKNNNAAYYVYFLPFLILILGAYLKPKINILFGRFRKKGALLHYKWTNYKRYLQEHSNMYEKEIEEVHLWDAHLVYANAFGLTKKINEIFPKLFVTKSGSKSIELNENVLINTKIKFGRP